MNCSYNIYLAPYNDRSKENSLAVIFGYDRGCLDSSAPVAPLNDIEHSSKQQGRAPQ